MDLRVPTFPLEVEIQTTDGQDLKGSVFLPAVSPVHDGHVSIEEWASEVPTFFPFLPVDSATPVLLNAATVLALTCETEPDVAFGAAPLTRALLVECGQRRFTGEIVIDLPEGQQRTLDYLNQPSPFLTLHDDTRRVFVQKRHITRVSEPSTD
jgi:hypothetical protein